MVLAPRSQKKREDPSFSRQSTMVCYAFRRTSARYEGECVVKLSVLETLEIIEVASDWQLGKKLSNQGEHWNTGYIASGFSKIGIYARYEDNEYVITTLSRDNPDTEDVLRAEFQLLCIGDTLKSAFEERAGVCGLELPQFYFNFKGAILGEIVLDKETATCILPHRYFIATPLLPCSRVDGPVRKFTGSEDVGDAPDRLTKAIHAFAHFSLLYTNKFMLLCDLQGLNDKDGAMCLIDPECHTDTDTFNRWSFWDCGPRKIQRFLDQHVASGMCKDNCFCRALISAGGVSRRRAYG